MLKAKQNNPEDSQGEPVNLTDLHEPPANLCRLAACRERFFASTSFQTVASLPLKKCTARITIPITSRT
jgi:hypothetical protein